MKVIVFDLDETIGHFHQISALCWLLKRLNNREMSMPSFFNLMDLFPKYLDLEYGNYLNIL